MNQLGHEEQWFADHRSLVKQCFMAPEGCSRLGFASARRTAVPGTAAPVGAAAGHSPAILQL